MRCEASIDYDWGAGVPQGVTVPADRFSVRWTGRFNFAAGSYTFVGLADDGIRAWLDGGALFDAWNAQGTTEYQATRSVTTGVHEVRVEYYEAGGQAAAHFRW